MRSIREIVSYAQLARAQYSLHVLQFQGSFLLIHLIFILRAANIIHCKETIVGNYDKEKSSSAFHPQNFKHTGRRRRYHLRSLHCLTQQQPQVHLHSQGI